MRILNPLILTLAFIFGMSSSLLASSIDRVGIKVEGESTWVPGVQVLSGTGDLSFITTEKYAKDRTLENVTIYPDDAFDVMDPRSVADFVGGNPMILGEQDPADKNGNRGFVW